MTQRPGTETSVGAEYMFSRGFRDSARLHLQHWIWKEHLGYILHPSIIQTEANWRVADVGTGNACWLLDLAQQVPTSWSLEGFDVSAKQFPAKENIPDNVSLKEQNAFDEVPEHLLGKFDIVHIRAFAAVIKNGNPDPLLQNLIKMIKPGGYLQWDEFDSGTFSAHSSSVLVSKQKADEIIQVWRKFAQELGIHLSWMSPGSMTKNFRKHKLSVVNDTEADRWTAPGQFKSLLRKAYTDNWMMALEEVGFVIISRAGGAMSGTTAKDFTKLLDETVQETLNGVNLWIDMQVVVGKVTAN